MISLLNKEFTMELISKLEKTVLGWAKNVPHLPATAQKWLGLNIWWIVLIVAIISAIAFLSVLNNLFKYISLLGTSSSAYYINASYANVAVMNTAITLVFIGVITALLGFSIQPLKDRQKKGWVLLFFAALVQALSIIVNAVLSFSVGGFIVEILFGAIIMAIVAYFITEIHGEFAHPVKKVPAKKA